MDRNIIHGEPAFATWQQFWDYSLRGLKHDLPDWHGTPASIVWIRQVSSKKGSCILAQKDDTTYYVVNYSSTGSR